MGEKLFLRDAIGEAMLSFGERNDKVVAVSADVMASCRVASFFGNFPERSFNTGIAEQEMISFSAGLAREGFIVYAFTMGPFMSMRACEQVRTDVAYNNLNVRMVSTYSGVSGGISGATHWALEDCAIMNGIPGMTILEPCDYNQTLKMMETTLDYTGAVYIRVSIEPVRKLYDERYTYQIGKANCLMDGDQGAFICSGVTVQYAVEAATLLRKKDGIYVKVIDMHTVKPIDRESVMQAAKTKNIIVAQDHNIYGGLGQNVAAVLAEEGIGINFKSIGIPDRFVAMAHAPYLYHEFGYDPDGLYKAMRDMIIIGCPRGGDTLS